MFYLRTYSFATSLHTFAFSTWIHTFCIFYLSTCVLLFHTLYLKSAKGSLIQVYNLCNILFFSWSTCCIKCISDWRICHVWNYVVSCRSVPCLSDFHVLSVSNRALRQQLKRPVVTISPLRPYRHQTTVSNVMCHKETERLHGGFVHKTILVQNLEFLSGTPGWLKLTP